MVDPKKFRESWLKGMKEHVAVPALGARLAAKHKPSEGTPAPPAANDEASPPMEGHTQPTHEMPPMDDPAADDAMGGDPCPHCGTPMKKKPMHHEPKGMDHGLGADDLALLLSKHG